MPYPNDVYGLDGHVPRDVHGTDALQRDAVGQSKELSPIHLEL